MHNSPRQDTHPNNPKLNAEGQLIFLHNPAYGSELEDRPKPEAGLLGEETADISAGLNFGNEDSQILARGTIVAECMAYGIPLGALAFLFATGKGRSLGTQVALMALGAVLGGVFSFFIGKLLALYAFRASNFFGRPRQIRSQGPAEDDVPPDSAALDSEIAAVGSSTSLGTVVTPEPSALLDLLEEKENLLLSIDSALAAQAAHQKTAGGGLLHIAWSTQGCGFFCMVSITTYGSAKFFAWDTACLFSLVCLIALLYALARLRRAWLAGRSARRQAAEQQETVTVLMRRLGKLNQAISRWKDEAKLLNARSAASSDDKQSDEVPGDSPTEAV